MRTSQISQERAKMMTRKLLSIQVRCLTNGAKMKVTTFLTL